MPTPALEVAVQARQLSGAAWFVGGSQQRSKEGELEGSAPQGCVQKAAADTNSCQLGRRLHAAHTLLPRHQPWRLIVVWIRHFW